MSLKQEVRGEFSLHTWWSHYTTKQQNQFKKKSCISWSLIFFIIASPGGKLKCVSLCVFGTRWTDLLDYLAFKHRLIPNSPSSPPTPPRAVVYLPGDECWLVPSSASVTARWLDNLYVLFALPCMRGTLPSGCLIRDSKTAAGVNFVCKSTNRRRCPGVDRPSPHDKIFNVRCHQHD